MCSRNSVELARSGTRSQNKDHSWPKFKFRCKHCGLNGSARLHKVGPNSKKSQFVQESYCEIPCTFILIFVPFSLHLRKFVTTSDLWSVTSSFSSRHLEFLPLGCGAFSPAGYELFFHVAVVCLHVECKFLSVFAFFRVCACTIFCCFFMCTFCFYCSCWEF